MRKKGFFLFMTLLFNLFLGWGFYQESADAKDPYDQLISNMLGAIDYDLSQSSLEKLKYERFVILEFVSKNKNQVDLEKLQKSEGLNRLNYHIDFRTNIANCLDQRNIIKIGSKNSKGANATDDGRWYADVSHPMKSKFVGVNLFEVEDYDFLKELNPKFLSRINCTNLNISQQDKNTCNDGNDKAIDKLLAYGKKLQYTQENQTKDLKKFIANPDEGYENYFVKYHTCRDAGCKQQIVDIVCKNALPYFLKNEDFSWRGMKDVEEKFKNDKTALVNDVLNITSFLEYAKKNKKLKDNQYNNFLDRLSQLDFSKNKAQLIKDLEPISSDIKKMLAELSKQSMSNDQRLMVEKLNSNFNRIEKGIGQVRNGIPSSFRRYMMRLPDYVANNPEQVRSIGAMINLLTEADKKIVFDTLRNTDKAWASLEDPKLCEKLSEKNINQ